MQLSQQLPAAWPGKAINTYHFLPIWHQRFSQSAKVVTDNGDNDFIRLLRAYTFKKGKGRRTTFCTAAPSSRHQIDIFHPIYIPLQSAAARPRVWRFSFFPAAAAALALIWIHRAGCQLFHSYFIRTWLANSSTTRARGTCTPFLCPNECCRWWCVCRRRRHREHQTDGQTQREHQPNERRTRTIHSPPALDANCSRPAGWLAHISYSRQY